ncbi:MAG: DUF4280 domain-containing protein [Phycisphaerales bacterium]|nr:DUF4280 domain-containing protein [Phycisphaerales bacterium]
MPKLVVNNATLKCSCGTTPSSLSVVPVTTKGENQPAATIMDFAPSVNIKPFGMCTTTSNPQVAAATSAASGVLTPQPCIPATVAPWSPGCSKVTIDGKPALHDGCTCKCMWTGSISVNTAGQSKIEVS